LKATFVGGLFPRRMAGRIALRHWVGSGDAWLDRGHTPDTRAFLEWRLRHGLSLSGTAQALGLSRRMVAYYSNGEKPVPRPILLACRGWEADAAD
jgi:hypothetical protein